jgi:hypothetical protein
MKAWKELRDQFESNEIEMQKILISEAENIKKNHPNHLTNYLENKSNEFAFKAMEIASDMADKLKLGNKN